MDQIENHIREILISADLETITAKQVRRKLLADNVISEGNYDKSHLSKMTVKIMTEIIEKGELEKNKRKAVVDDSSSSSSNQPTITQKTVSQPAQSASRGDDISAQQSSSQSAAVSSSSASMITPLDPTSSSKSSPSSSLNKKRKRTTKSNLSREIVLDHTDLEEVTDIDDEDISSLDKTATDDSVAKELKKKKSKSTDKKSSTAKKHKLTDEENSSTADDEEFARNLQNSLSNKRVTRAVSSGETRTLKKRTKVTGEKKKVERKSPPVEISEDLRKIVGQEELNRYEVVKKLWEYIKLHDLQDPKDKRYILCDEKLAVVTGKDRIHQMHLSKALTRHVFHPEKISEPILDARVIPKKNLSKRSKKLLGDYSNVKSEKKTAFSTPYRLSDVLFDIVGVRVSSRPQLVKKIFAYIKLHGLQDPKDKRYVLCDEKLAKLCDNEERMYSFTLNKYLGKHLTKLEPHELDSSDERAMEQEKNEQEPVEQEEEEDEDENTEKSDEENVDNEQEEEEEEITEEIANETEIIRQDNVTTKIPTIVTAPIQELAKEFHNFENRLIDKPLIVEKAPLIEEVSSFTEEEQERMKGIIENNIYNNRIVETRFEKSMPAELQEVMMEENSNSNNMDI